MSRWGVWEATCCGRLECNIVSYRDLELCPHQQVVNLSLIVFRAIFISLEHVASDFNCLQSVLFPYVVAPRTTQCDVVKVSRTL